MTCSPEASSHVTRHSARFWEPMTSRSGKRDSPPGGIRLIGSDCPSERTSKTGAAAVTGRQKSPGPTGTPWAGSSPSAARPGANLDRVSAAPRRGRRLVVADPHATTFLVAVVVVVHAAVIGAAARAAGALGRQGVVPAVSRDGELRVRAPDQFSRRAGESRVTSRPQPRRAPLTPKSHAAMVTCLTSCPCSLVLRAPNRIAHASHAG